MIKWNWLYLMVAAIFFNISVASAANNNEHEMRTGERIYSDDKTAIIVSPNKPTFTLRLTSNPTTGYSWTVRKYDPHLITPLRHRYQAPISKRMGAGGYELWTFRVKPEGFVVPHQTSIQMLYAQPWSPEQNTREMTFKIVTMDKEKAE